MRSQSSCLIINTVHLISSWLQAFPGAETPAELVASAFAALHSLLLEHIHCRGRISAAYQPAGGSSTLKSFPASCSRPEQALLYLLFPHVTASVNC
jgi:hypothetical protein